MKARFRRDGVELDLTKDEYIFVYLLLSYGLHGVELEDHDFRNILGMSRVDAERLMQSIRAVEREARARGDHWNPLRA
ncbi:MULTISPECIES: hypothetical protein [unclassified Aeromicrobium]|uniref:hypothetical protein n=1 Tax=unclassified Aeromicrobium TaxID=2633570 RepID=UPI0020982270|nr:MULTISPECIES: hypothetical protein [unclassified Aeromicrobium]MCO7237746.1 hypothetical protein [Aeromicrobium sp. CnD17-E]MDR6117707.1 hypothetical protein [Aeromicrobium sp. SORGH_AS_0981]